MIKVVIIDAIGKLSKMVNDAMLGERVIVCDNPQTIVQTELLDSNIVIKSVDDNYWKVKVKNDEWMFREKGERVVIDMLKGIEWDANKTYLRDVEKYFMGVVLYRSDDGNIISSIYSYETQLYFEERMYDGNGKTQIWEVVLDWDERLKLEGYFGQVLSVSEKGLLKIIGNHFNGKDVINELMEVLIKIGIDTVPILRMNGCSIG